MTPHRDCPKTEPPSPPHAFPNAGTSVCIVIPILNESETLEATLGAVATQDYPRDLLEVIIVDGGSADEWRSSLAVLGKAGVRCRVLSNPRRVTSAAVNLAIHSTDAEAILWLSGHCVLSPGYITSVIAAFCANPKTVVGGWLKVNGEGFAGQLNSMVLRSRFGTGFATWRTSSRSGWSKSATYAAYNRQLLIQSGGLNENLVRNQDTELVARLAREGIRFYVANAPVTYLAPRSLSALLRKAWGNGAWAIWSWKSGFRSFSLFHLVPGLALIVGLLLAVLSLRLEFARVVLGALALTYAGLSLWCASRRAILDRRAVYIPFLILWFALHHAAYGLGTLIAFVAPRPKTEVGVDANESGSAVR